MIESFQKSCTELNYSKWYDYPLLYSSCTISTVRDYKQSSSEDQRAWELSKPSFDWKHVVLLVSFGIGLVIFAVLFILQS